MNNFLSQKNSSKLVKLGDLCKIIRGASPRPKGDSRYFGGNIPWIKISDVTKDDEKYLNFSVEGLTLQGKSKSVFLEKETLILTNSATVGLPKILNISGCIHDGFLAFLDLSPSIERDYLYYWFLANRENIIQLAPSGTQKNLNTDIVKSLDILLPSTNQQKQIVSILDMAFEIKQEKKRANLLMRLFAHSLFNKIFGNFSTNSKGWIEKTFEEMAIINRKIVNPSKIDLNYKYVGLEDIESETGRIIKFETPKIGKIKSSKFFFTSDHILYGKLRPYLNKVALPEFDGICSTDILPILPRENITNKYFLSYFLQSKFFTNYASENVAGANLPRISPKDINKFVFPCPPFELQKEFAKIIISYQSSKKIIDNSLIETNYLFESILKQAYKINR